MKKPRRRKAASRRKVQYQVELTWKCGDTLMLTHVRSTRESADPLFDSMKWAIQEIDRYLNGASGREITMVRLIRVIKSTVKVWRA